MRHFQYRVSAVQVVFLLFLVLACSFALGAPKGQAEGYEKVSPGLARLMDRYQANRDLELPVIVQVAPDRFHPHGAPPGLVDGLAVEKVLGLVTGYSGRMSIGDIEKLVHSSNTDQDPSPLQRYQNGAASPFRARQRSPQRVHSGQAG